MKASAKRKLKIILTVVLIVGALAGAVYYAVFSNRKRPELGPEAIIQVDRGDITAVYTASATVSSGRQGTFQVLDGTKVNEVLVRVGDTVQAGDLLATFDTASLDEMLRAKKRDFEAAQKSYSDYLKSAADAPKQAAANRARIAELEAKIAAQGEEEERPPQAPQNTQLDELKASITQLLGNAPLAGRIVDAVFNATGSISSTVSSFQNLLSGGLMGSLLGGGGYDMSALQGMMGSFGGGGMGDSMELMMLKMQDAFSGISETVSMDSVYKSLADSAEDAYRQAERTAGLLKGGWVAQFDGIIREVNIAEGQVYRDPQGQSAAASGINVTSLLASMAGGNMDITALLGGLFSNQVNGMVIEYYPFTASFVVGKYDIAKLSLDMPVRVTSISDKEFEGYVSFISPVAGDGGSDMLGSILGGGGGGSARGVEARVTIPQPDKSITIGLDVDVTIDLETREDVLRVPVESVAYDDDGYYVFRLERVSRTLHKQPVDTGLFDGVFYEITGGLDVGTELVRVPKRAMTDGQKVKLV